MCRPTPESLAKIQVGYDEHETGRYHALWALGAIGSDVAATLPRLRELASNPDDSSAKVLEELKSILSTDVVLPTQEGRTLGLCYFAFASSPSSQPSGKRAKVMVW